MRRVRAVLLRGQRLFERRVLRGRGLHCQRKHLPQPALRNLFERSLRHLRRRQRYVLRELDLHGRQYVLPDGHLSQSDLVCSLRWRWRSVLPRQSLFGRWVLYRSGQWQRYRDMQGRGNDVQRQYLRCVFGGRMRDLRRAWECVLCEQPLYGVAYPVPDGGRARRAGKLRSVRRSQSTLLPQHDHWRSGFMFGQARVPGRYHVRRSVYLRGLRRGRAALLWRQQHRWNGSLPVRECLPDVLRQLYVLLCGLRRKRAALLRREHLHHRYVQGLLRHLSVEEFHRCQGRGLAACWTSTTFTR